VKSLLAAALLACGLGAHARAASDDDNDDVSKAVPAARVEESVPIRPENVVAGDTNSDAAKVLRRKGGPDHAAVHGGAVIINADGSRLEIAPTNRPKTETLSIASPSLPAKLKLPSLPALDDPRAPLAERKRRAQYLLGGTLAALLILFYWARSRWRPGV
jgi:hypothetical protein